MAKLGSKAVGSIVKLNVNGVAKNFIVVHQGKPPAEYDDSCNGTWLLMQDIYESRTYSNAYHGNIYMGSSLWEYYDDTFVNLFDSDIRDAIKEVNLPYTEDSSNIDHVALLAKVFPLSYVEVGFSGDTYAPIEGGVLDYFKNATDAKRIGYLNKSAASWSLRTPWLGSTQYVYVVDSSGAVSSTGCAASCGVRPALVLPSTLSVTDDGAVVLNIAPTITSTSGTSGVNLGTKSAGFNLSYTVSDADGDSLTITEKMDGVTKKTFTSTGGTYTFDAVKTANFFKVLNGTHTLTVEVNDGSEITTFTATFTKSVTSASITLDNALAVAGDITAAVLAVTGSIPDDATYIVEVTNNANDTTPLWQNVTSEVKNGSNIVFTNSVCTNGAAFNFRISVSRGASGEGGHISAVSGAFQ